MGVVVDNVNVDGEMRVDALHLVLVSSLDSREHVVDVRADGSNTGNSFTVGEPYSDEDGSLAKDKLALQVLEAFLQLSTGTINSDETSVDLDLAINRDVDRITSTNLLHD